MTNGRLLSIDYENNAEKWWDSGGRDLWESFAGDAYSDNIFLSESDINLFLKMASKIPGWNEGPAYAKNPVVVSDL